MPRPLNQTDTDLNAENLLRLPAEFGCPVWVYDAQIVREKIAALHQFDVVRFAQKACSNIHILRLMREQGVKVDSVSLGEIERALAAGFDPKTDPDAIVFTADVIDDATLARVHELQVPVNAGSVDMLEQLGQVSPGHRVWLRVNPGFGHGHSQKTNTGGENSKHGIWYADMPAALEVLQRYSLKLVGIHMHIGSGVDYGHLEQVCGAMVRQVVDFGQDLEAISAGGGLSIPYREGEEAIDTDHYYGLWSAARDQIAAHQGHAVKLEIEPGRFLVAEAGVLVAQVRSVKEMGSRHFVLIDAGFNDLMRPSMYGSYHHITALAADGRDLTHAPRRETVVAGPLCESGDVFTQQEGGKVETRALPEVKPGDYLVLHDTGAYGASMSSNYNSRPLLPEVLFDNGKARLIRRRQTIQELLALELV
ncbi:MULTISPECIES: diaminopimelate decarboxylase [unclassified Enterobacter cloacae complex]|uniref:diaminopimelate decarboxylase n=1 Tax=unclassified Enterobacter cloacae complex TaxID=2757714 RepID=UPI0018721C18|nr:MULTISPECIES: diaminopimelate decarboxylase [unclassified Enterobacter cloacae complex]HDS2774024.1 diaminopimelate decarboxylase [Enterobacter bugandensis]MBE4810093.1 diaminopimelate decarboxylase [Enterobacter cloacae complex sp. P44RS]MBE4827923.1 diaminopimelate decarboxylase [Enterobacter cloacae complex sp. P42RS]MBE4836229.1 diaminopimelate decarboxylase [Enterobacter cloacae complex sp. P46RS]MBE4839870.1 diaminopimelate decarboxylase [Enterobacter cloacae complex sp. P42C]